MTLNAQKQEKNEEEQEVTWAKNGKKGEKPVCFQSKEFPITEAFDGC